MRCLALCLLLLAVGASARRLRHVLDDGDDELAAALAAWRVTPISGDWHANVDPQPPVDCSKYKGYVEGTSDDAVMLGRAVIDSYFVQDAQPDMKRKNPAFYCPRGAVDDEGKPIYSAAAAEEVLLASKHHGVAVCVPKGQERTPTHGTAYASGTLYYYCRGSESVLHVVGLEAAGKY